MAEDRTRVAQDGADHFVALPSGFLLGKYQLEAVLGQGGFGITYRGRDRELDRAVAIKEYLPADVATRIDASTVRPRSRNDQDNFQWGLERFLAEARALARFDSNPSIVRVHDYMQANGTAYMVMALIDGTPLSVIYRREAPLSEERLKAIVLPILDGLEDVHNSGFLHRDIKPANILVRANGQPVLIDFGAARQSLGEKSRSITSVFTPGYAPFEQYMSSGKQGPWTDIYAMAATLYHGISGMVPPQATDRMREDPMPPAQRLGAGRYTPAFLAAIDRGMEVHENRRPHSVAQWRDMLTGVISAALPAAAQPVVAPPPPAPLAAAPRKRGVATVAAAAALGLVVLGGVGAAVHFGLGEKAAAPETVQQRAERLAEEARLAAEEARKAQQAIEAEAQRRAELEVQQRAREQQRRQEQEAQTARAEAARREAERARQENDGQRQRAADEEARRQQEVEAQRRAELARAEQERRASEEARRKAETELVEARKQAEEARRQADDLRQQAERARAAAEAEAVRKTADEARLKAETEAKRRAEEEAKKKAQDDAKAKAETEAKARAEAEVKRKAEEEARRKAEEDARRRAPTPAPSQQQAAAPPPAPAPADPAAYVTRHWPQLKNSVETAAASAAMSRGVRLGSVDGYDVLEVSDARIVLRVRVSVTPPYGPSNVRPAAYVLAFQNRPSSFPVIGEQGGAVAAAQPPADPAAYVKQHWRDIQAAAEPALERFLINGNRRLQSIDRYDIVSAVDGRLVLRLKLTVVAAMGYSSPQERFQTVEFRNEPPDFPVVSVK